jgi:putative transposase
VEWGFLLPGHYRLLDRDGMFCATFQQTMEAAGVELVVFPARSPNLNAYAERWVRAVKDEALSRLILFGEDALRRALQHDDDPYHTERPHQGKGNVVLVPAVNPGERCEGPIRCRERLGGLLKYDYREAA